MRHRVVLWEFFLVLAVLALGVLHVLEVAAIEPVYRAALLLGVFYLFHLASPVRLIFGGRHVPFDLFMVFSFILLAGGRAFAFLSGFAEGTIMLFGAFLLGITCWMAARDLPVVKHSALGAFKSGNRGVHAFILALGFFVMIFQPIVWITLSLGQMPWVRPVTSVLALLLLLQEQGFIDSRILSGTLTRIGAALAEFSGLFMHRRTILLGVTGLLVVQFVAQVGGSLLPLAAQTLTVLEGVYLLVGLVSLAGAFALFILPVYIWWKTLLVRKSHEHLPDWPPWRIGAVLGCIVAAFLFPLVELLPVGQGAALMGVISGDPVLALMAGALVFVLCLVIGMTEDYLRRVLMMGPFLAAAVFFGAYAYNSFVGTFFSTAAAFFEIPVAIPVVAALGLIRVLFLVTGYLSFLYEAWRD